MPHEQCIISVAVIQPSLTYKLKAMLLVQTDCSNVAAAHFKHCLRTASCLAGCYYTLQKKPANALPALLSCNNNVQQLHFVSNVPCYAASC